MFRIATICALALLTAGAAGATATTPDDVVRIGGDSAKVTRAGAVRIAVPLFFQNAGNYTFIATTPDGRRVSWLPGSRLGGHTYRVASTAPVAEFAATRAAVIIGLFPRRRTPISLRIIRTAFDGAQTATEIGRIPGA